MKSYEEVQAILLGVAQNPHEALGIRLQAINQLDVQVIENAEAVLKMTSEWTTDPFMRIIAIKKLGEWTSWQKLEKERARSNTASGANDSNLSDEDYDQLIETLEDKSDHCPHCRGTGRIVPSDVEVAHEEDIRRG